MTWQTKKLGEICDFYNGLWKGKKPPYVEVGVIRNTNFTKDGELDSSDIAYLSVEIKQLKKRKLFFGDIILEKSGGGPKQPVGRVIIFDKKEGDFSFSNFTSAIRAKDHKEIDFNYLHRFLHFSYLSGVTESMQSHSTGIRNLDLNKYKEIKINFPSLLEQKRIVKILDEAFDKIEKAKENAEKNLQNSKELFESYLENIIADKKDKWDKKKLNEICIVERGSSPRPIQKYLTDSSDGVNWIKIGDTKNIERYLYKTKQKITKKGAEKSRFVKEGDLILSNSMSFGRPYIMKTTGYIHDGWFVLRPNPNLDTEYFYDVISSPQIQKQMKILASGSVVKNISGDLVKKVILPIPNLSEQKLIVKKLDSLSEQTKKLEGVYRQKLADLEELKKSVLNKAFTGEL